MMEKLTKELILKQEDATNPEIKSAKQGFAYGPSTSKTAKPYALNTLRKRAKIGVCDTTSRTASYNIFRLLIPVLIVLAPVATAVDIVALWQRLPSPLLLPSISPAASSPPTTTQTPPPLTTTPTPAFATFRPSAT
jgi:hypothetical protein